MQSIQLSIPQPCHENWEGMTPEEKGRFCASCQKIIVDFSTMSDTELLQFFSRKEEGICGRFSGQQLQREIRLPAQPLQWPRYLLPVMLPALLLSTPSSGQKAAPPTEQVPPRKEPIDLMLGEVAVVRPVLVAKGRVVDEKGEGVSYASVMVMGTQKGVACDSAGNFSLPGVEPGQKLVASAIDHPAETVVWTDTASVQIVLKKRLAEVMYMGIVITTQHKRKKKEKLPLIQKLVDTVRARFTVFPNPAKGGTMVQLKMGSLEKGTYIVSVLSNSGEIVVNREVEWRGKKETIPLQLPELPSGTYYVSLFEKANGRSYTQKIFVD